ncbi:putative beta-glucosidase d protein [Botrytis fragariae]|uniref:beta-glucosidase n=1 Tax=Botrytis fragariae TaxID=1964551 RepID=A0A8H6EMB2_9HELO|nr:putative beta-glucosidase d protein [Botrytis fragariae]KAF5877125.1 putative beta-glucosidase d protein [Botrytis fragariae]
MKGHKVLSVASALSFFTVGLCASNSTTTTSTSSSGLLADGNVNLGAASDAYEKAVTFISSLTNAQKIAIITGQSINDDNATWTPLVTKNGAVGINMNFFVSGFSTPQALTMTWNRTLFLENFSALGKEFYAVGASLIDGPVSSPMGRVAYGGRNGEGFAPDPYLNGIAMGQAIAGINSGGVITAGRHFLFNEQETNRTTTDRYSSNVDDKTTREVYLWPFADAVKSGMMAAMCAMNKVNSTLSCENSELLNNYLKTAVGFPGMVIPDQGAQATSFGSANGGLDYGSSSLWTEEILEAGIANGSFTQERLDDMAVRNVIGYYFAGLDDGLLPSEVSYTDYRDVREDHADIIRQVGGEALVLVKNTQDGTGRGLPLSKPRTISLFGAHAGPAMAGPNRAFSVQGTPADTYQGHLGGPGGSGQPSLSYLVTPFQAISARAIADRSMIWWVLNNTYTDSSSSSSGMGGGMSGGMPTTNANSTSITAPAGTSGNSSSSSDSGSTNSINLGNLGSGTALSPSISNYALNSAACLVFINADAGEGADRGELSNDEQDTMVTTVANNCNNTIVVVNTVGPRILDAWIEHENVTAVLYSGLLGQESGNAIADVLYGDVNPSAKLGYTLPKNASDYPSEFNICEEDQCNYTEGVYLDYRYFDDKNITVRYPFGFGLSYTNFTYSTEVTATITNQTALTYKYASGQIGLGGEADLWDDVLNVTTSVSNSGAVAGAEVAQLYISFPDEAEQPIRILRGFEKVNIAPGESADISFSLRRRDLSYWDTVAQAWAVASGDYTISVGASSRDLKASTTLTLTTDSTSTK